MTETHAAKQESMLVRSENLDQLLLLAGEVIISSSNLALTYRQLQAVYDRKDAVNRELLDSVKDLSESTNGISSNLHELVQAIRTVALKDLGFRAKRLVRDLARRSGKRINFVIEGEDTVVDKSIVEKLFDPIAHQLRNAIDHGIEDVETRKRAGKPEEGTVRLRMYNTEHETFFEIEDDGAGIDRDTLQRKAQALGRAFEGQHLTDDVLLEIMCLPGVSAAGTITEVSGRGVGMDVVRNRIADLGGSITFKTASGKGSTFTFRVPLVSAVNIVDALVVQAGENLYAFPILSVVTNQSIARSNVSTTLERGRMIKYLDHLVPLYDLAGVLGQNEAAEKGDTVSILIVEHKDQQIALVVDAFMSPQKLVIIPIDNVLDVPEISGATILSGRRLGFIVDVPSLVNRALGKTALRSREIIATEGLDEVPAPSAADLAEPLAPPSTEEASPQFKNERETREFLVEVERMIPGLNEVLFKLEADPDNSEFTNKAFRLLHTIKGNFIMIGLSQAGSTIHSVESVLDRARSGKLQVTSEVMDLLMDVASFIEGHVRSGLDGRGGDQGSTAINERSADFLPDPGKGAKAIGDVATEQVRLSHESAYRAIIHRKRHRPRYRCFVEFDPGPQSAALIACLIYRRLCELGDVLGTVPSLRDIEKGLVNNQLKALIATDLDYETMKRTLSDLLHEHYGASTVELTRFE